MTTTSSFPSRRPQALLALAALLSGAGVRSAEGQAVPTAAHDTISFTDAIGIALRQNATLRSAVNALSLSSTIVSSRKQAFLPSLQVSTSEAQTLGRNFNPSEGTIVDQTTQSVNAGLSSSLTLFNPQNASALKQARLNESASGTDLTRARQTTVFSVASDYLTLITRQEQLRVQHENLTALDAQEGQVRKLVDAGVRSVSDLYQQQAITAGAQSSVTAADRDVELAKMALIQTLQLDPRGTYTFAPPAVSLAPSALGVSLDVLLDRAFAQRADLASEATRLSAANEAVKGASGGRLPVIAVTAGYNTAFSSATDLALASQLNQRRGGSLSVGVSLPIFDRGATATATEQARLQEDNARLALDNVRQTVALDVRRAYLDFETARQQLTSATAQQKAADLAVSTTQQRYQLGSSTLLELTQARALQLQAASAVVTAQYTVVFQRALISYYTGALDPAHVSLAE
ncbi:MAG: TolC family protein [bacterium]